LPAFLDRDEVDWRSQLEIDRKALFELGELPKDFVSFRIQL
jgi:hypothetical protein